MELDLDYLRGWIGRTDEAAEMLTAASVNRFNATFDRQFAAEEGNAAPALFHFCLCQPATKNADLSPDGHAAKGGFIPPVPLPRRMWAGSDITFHSGLLIGETIHRTSVIEDVVAKEGRSGKLCFVTVTHRFKSGGRAAITDKQTIVYRAPDSAEYKSGAPRKTPPPAPVGTTQKAVVPSAPLLFRYSALTFNSHRIHYDTPYATEDEGYPALVVHGPLQATLLALFAVELRGSKLSAFGFRSVSPLFHTSDFTINAHEEDDAMKLWTARSGGPVAMEATARW